MNESGLKTDNLSGTEKIDENTRKFFLDLARGAIAWKLGVPANKPDISMADPEILNREKGVYIKISVDDQLRGCLGMTAPPDKNAKYPLRWAIPYWALQALTSDHRFEPVRPDEFCKMELTITILEPPRPQYYADAKSLLSALMGHHDKAVQIEHFSGSSLSSAIYLPCVWEKYDSEVIFLTNLAKKAGINPRLFNEPGQVSVWLYEAESIKG